MRQGSEPMRAQVVTPPGPQLGALTLNGEDGSFTFVPSSRRAMVVRFFARAFNGQEWSDPFKVTLVFFRPSFGRHR